MFKSCTSVNNCEWLFSECTQLKIVEEGLFDDLVNMEYVGGLFRKCEILETIPSDIFDHQNRVKDFHLVFADCYKLSCESPHSLIDGKKVYLYERESFPDYFVSPTSYVEAFRNCKNMLDYKSIPSTWK